MLYLDTSALVKRYVVELDSATVIASIASAPVTATSAIAYAEARAAFARALRTARVDNAGHAALVARLDADWPGYVVLPADDARIREAGQLVDRHTGHALRGFDAIHLSCAIRLAGGDPSSVTFACWDLRLWRAARDEGFTMLPSTEPR
jgi:predicted nucleic acid-binding protein